MPNHNGIGTISSFGTWIYNPNPIPKPATLRGLVFLGYIIVHFSDH